MLGNIELDMSSVEKMYLEDEMPMHEISKVLGVSVGTVYNRMKQYGIPSRDQKSTFTFSGRKHTPDTLKKISLAHKGKTVSDATRLKMSIADKHGGIGHKKINGDGYVLIYFPDHPRSRRDGYISEHTLVMEALIGRHLSEDECVHHINGIKNDNRKENLLLLTKSEHMSLHMKQRHQKKGGMTYQPSNPNGKIDI